MLERLTASEVAAYHTMLELVTSDSMRKTPSSWKIDVVNLEEPFCTTKTNLNQILVNMNPENGSSQDINQSHLI